MPESQPDPPGNNRDNQDNNVLGPTRDPQDPRASGPNLMDMMPQARAGLVAERSSPGPPEPPVSPGPPSREALIAALQTVYDPELPVDIHELGLIYALEQQSPGDVRVTMSLTTPNCPVAGVLPQQVADALASVAGVQNVRVYLTFTPPWTPERMSEDARLALDIGPG